MERIILKTDVEDLGANTVKIKIEVPALEFEKSLSAAYRKLAAKLNIPGFRKGKAPRDVVRNVVGKEALLDEAAQIAVPEVYASAIEEAGIDPVGRPSIDVVQIDEDSSFIFTATVQVIPEVDLGDISSVEIDEVSSAAAKEEIDKRLDEMRQHSAKLEVAKRGKVKEGDFIHLDFDGYIAGKPFEGGAATDYVLEVGSGSFIPGFEEQLVGLKKGEEHSVDVTFPEQYSAAHLAGQDAVFKVVVKEIKQKKLPELGDAFAKSVSEFDTLAELSKDVASKLEERKEEQNKVIIRNAVVDAVAAQAKVELPSELVNRYVQDIADEFSQYLESQQQTLSAYLESLEDKGAALREQMGIDAEKRARTGVVLSEVVKKEGVKVEDAEIDEELQNMADRNKQDLETVKAQFGEDGREYLRQRLAVSKAVDILVTRVKMTKKEKKVTETKKKAAAKEES